MTSAAQSLHASADAFRRMGREYDAIFTRSMAEQCERMPQGDALYRNWAAQQAERVIAKQSAHSPQGIDQ